jgi:DNA-binding SARP family transcriptional activator/TolB-like protein
MARLHTLGRFELCGAAGEPFQVQPKRLALLAFLAAAAPRGAIRRDTVLGLFWPELGQAEARRALRQALHYLRRFAGPDAIATRADDQVMLGDELWCDVRQFARCVEEHDDAAALQLYRGDFLAGVFLTDVAPEFDEWLERTRLRLRTQAAAAAWRLSEQQIAAGDVTAAAASAIRALELAPDDENALRRALDLLARTGDRGRALRLYDAYAQRLAREFDATPAAETVAVIERIRGEAHHPSPSPLAPVPPPLAHTPAPASAPALATAPAPAPPPRGTAPVVTAPRPAARVRAAALAAVITVAVVGAVVGLRARAAAGDDGDVEPATVLVADLASSLPDSALVRALSEIVRVDLAQSRGLRVLSPQQIGSALERMALQPGAPLSDSVARQLALREGVRAIVTGDVALVAGSYIVSVRLVSPADGELLTAARETADSSALIDAAGRLTRALRLQLGEPLRSVRATPRLSAVMTPSLPALRAYSEAMYQSEHTGDRGAAIALLDDAVALDPGFAAAHRMLGALHSSNADPGRATAALALAIQHRERLPFRERYLTMGSYYRNVTREYDKSIAAYRALLDLYPRDVAGLNNLSLVHAQQRSYAQAERLLLRAIAIDSTIPVVYLGLGQVLINQGRFAEAHALLSDVERRFPDHVLYMLTWTYLGAAQQDWVEAERHIRRRLVNARERNRTSDIPDALQTLGQIQLVTGRVDDAERTLREARDVAQSQNIARRVVFNIVQLAWLQLYYRDRPDVALALIDSMLVRLPLAQLSTDDRPYRELAEILAALGARDRLDRFVAMAEADTTARLDMEGAAGDALRGFRAAAHGRDRDAIRALRRVDATERCPICVLPALGYLYERTGDAEAAIAAYERYVDTPWMWRFESDAPHLGRVLGRLIVLYASAGRDAEASVMRARLQDLWRNADDDVRTRIPGPPPRPGG